MIFIRFVRKGWLPCLALAAALAGITPATAQTIAKRPSPTPKAGASPMATPGAAASPSVAPYVLPDPVATVNGEAITKKELEPLTAVLVGNNGKSLQDLPPAEKKQAYQSVLDSIVVDRLVNRASSTEKVEDLEVEKQYNKLISQYPTPQAFDEQVKKSGKTTDQLKANVLRQLAQQQWLERQIADAIKVTPEEAQKFYKESPPAQFDSPELIRARHILIAVRKDAPPEDAYLAEQKINALAERLKRGESFEAVAKEQSQDKAAKQNGGDLGYFSQDKIMPEFSAVAFKLKTNEISPPVRTQFGYHIIQLLDRKPPHTATFDEARDQITEYLQAEKRRKAVAQVVQGLRDKAKISVFLP